MKTTSELGLPPKLTAVPALGPCASTNTPSGQPATGSIRSDGVCSGYGVVQSAELVRQERSGVALGTVAAIFLGISGVAISTACTRASSVGERVVAAGPIAAAPRKGEARVMVKCAECGVVDSVRQVEIVGEADAMTGADHDGVLGKSTTSYEVTVRMRDGSDHVFMDANPANWRPGDRVTIIESAVGAEN